MNISVLTPEEINREIAVYERHSLESSSPEIVAIKDLLKPHQFIRISGMGNFWKDQPEVNYFQHVIDFVIGTHSHQDYFTFILSGNSSQVDLYISIKNRPVAVNLLKSEFPNIRIGENPVVGLGDLIQDRMKSQGMLSGIPSQKLGMEVKKTPTSQDFYQLERLIRGMQPYSWAYVVQAYARPLKGLIADRQKLLDKIASLASQTRGQIQQTTQRTNRVSEVMGGELVNRQAEYAVKILERELERLEISQATGRWQVAVYFGAEKPTETLHLASLLSGIFSGRNSTPDPLRYHFCQSGGRSPEQFHTYLTSEELALLVQPPREEMPGYSINEPSNFDVDFQPSAEPSLTLGSIIMRGEEIANKYSIPINDLTRHVAVFGVTGSGKTTTVLSMLYQLRNSHPSIPFMVIEPAKTEYRALLGDIVNNVARGPIPDVQIYSLGSDNISPFRLNPFEFDLPERMDSVSLLSHIDYLKAVFNAAFILYAPMPYVLDTALHEIYEDKGWNLATETNVRLNNDDWKMRDQYPIFPTLTDLYNKVESVTERLGYESRIEQDVIAGLKARIGALCVGAKGLMLDTPRGIPLGSLLKKPVILELENIGNDDEKTFLIGLVLARLYGYRRLQEKEGNHDRSLRHVLVVEEAHRILKNVSTQVDTEASNLRAQAVETFVNMLSEVRHYGQGVIVAEQIPSKLTPDVIKNTNLKIAHRLLAEDDRHMLGSTMNMDDIQIKRLAVLQPGEAAVYSAGDDHPLLIKAEYFKGKSGFKSPPSSKIPGFVESYTSLSSYIITPDFATFGLRIGKFGGPDPIVFQTANKHLGFRDNHRIWAGIIARAIFSRSTLPASIQNLRHRFSSMPGQLSPSQLNEAVLMYIVMGTAQSLETRGQEQNWSFSDTDSMRIALTNGLIKLARLNDLKACATDLDRFVRLYESALKRDVGPYPGCQSCQSVCLYRSETRRLLTQIDLGHIQDILATPKDKVAMYDEIKDYVKEMVQQWLGTEREDVSDISYCSILVVAPSLGLSEYEQTNLAQKMARLMF